MINKTHATQYSQQSSPRENGEPSPDREWDDIENRINNLKLMAQSQEVNHQAREEEQKKTIDTQNAQLKRWREKYDSESGKYWKQAEEQKEIIQAQSDLIDAYRAKDQFQSNAYSELLSKYLSLTQKNDTASPSSQACAPQDGAESRGFKRRRECFGRKEQEQKDLNAKEAEQRSAEIMKSWGKP